MITTASTCSIAKFFSASNFFACSRKIKLFAPFHFGSVSGKCVPISPSPAAPSSASQSACASTSPSECPTARSFLLLLAFHIKPRQLHVRWLCDLHVALGAQHHVHIVTHPLHQARFVGGAHPVRQCPRECFLQQFCRKCLRRLRQHDALTRNRCGNQRHIFR